ncbi:MAG: hypothetical protein LBI44_03425 [Oscillospiraceae bacterium]|jgi:aromatic ring-opening dioxygenase LigB subunit|nr:hypothetical protein [Oscillospiraceae bacterium]
MVTQAFALPHPPLAVPRVGKGEEAAIQTTLDAFDEVASRVAALAPDTVIFITPHARARAEYCLISPSSGASGTLARFGAPDVRFDALYNEELAREIAARAAEVGVAVAMGGGEDGPLDHGVTVPMWFINRRYTGYKAVRIAQSALSPREHYRLGQVIAEAARIAGGNTALVGSGDLSHKLLRSGPYGFAPEGPVFDKLITEAFASGNLRALLDIPEDTVERAAECGLRSFAVIAGCFGGKARGELLSYEGPFGVGYAVASFAPADAE